MKRGRLLIVSTDLEIGGTPTVVLSVAPRLAALGWEVTVVSLSGEGPVGRALVERGVRVVAMEGRHGMDVRVLWRLRRLLKPEKFDACLAYLFHAHAAMRAAGLGLAGAPPVVQVFQTAQPDPAWHWRVEGRLIARAAAVVAPTASVASAIEAYTGQAAAEVVVIPNGVERPKSLPPRRPSDGAFRVGFLGRLDRVKRVEVLIQAVKGREGVSLTIGGDGAERARLREEAAGMSNVSFSGVVEDKWAWLAGVDVLVLPSETEGFGLVLVEAMAAGVPVIGAKSPGIVDVIVDGENGLLFPTNDAMALCTVIERVRGDVGLRGRLVKGGAETARRYSWDAAVAGYDELLRQVVSSGAE